MSGDVFDSITGKGRWYWPLVTRGQDSANSLQWVGKSFTVKNSLD